MIKAILLGTTISVSLFLFLLFCLVVGGSASPEAVPVLIYGVVSLLLLWGGVFLGKLIGNNGQAG
ncbi:hypothetical protein [Gluconobacter albidus]|uniref:hypothetical protein n=1 Tax=Gluconobacter albidus TaxID=318683 RepID=UPI000A729EC1|nr:hypothetical protein [Gluconobacter albidus]